MVDRIVLLDGNEVIASHRRLAGKLQYSMDITHYIKTFHRKPGALPNARVLAQVDELILDLMVEPFAFCGGFEVTEPDLVAFDQLMEG